MCTFPCLKQGNKARGFARKQQGNTLFPCFHLVSQTRWKHARFCTLKQGEKFHLVSNKVKTREVLHVKTRWKLFTLFFWNKVKTFHLVWQTRWKRFTLFDKQGEKVSPCFIPLIYLNFIPSPEIIISPKCSGRARKNFRWAGMLSKKKILARSLNFSPKPLFDFNRVWCTIDY